VCSIYSNGIADEGFAAMDAPDKVKYEQELARLADEDTIEQANGLWLLLDSVKAWAMHDTLRRVKKYRKGRHRVYITGRHTDCEYVCCYVLAFKRDEDDQAKKESYQRMILNALRDPNRRQLRHPGGGDGEQGGGEGCDGAVPPA
jgi:hypothetical protein